MTHTGSHLVRPVGGADHTLGPRDAPHTLLEYGDYECPFCMGANRVVHAVRRRMGGELLYAFRHFPLVKIHPHAERAAEAAEAAGAQGRFWAMHEMLFEHQDALDAETLLEFAEALGLDVTRFANELATHVYRPIVLAQLESGRESGVQGTPTFFIDGTRHQGRYDGDLLIDAIRARGKAA